MSKKGGYRHIISAARQTGKFNWGLDFKHFYEIETWLRSPLLNEAAAEKYPNAKIALEIKNSPLYKAMQENEND